MHNQHPIPICAVVVAFNPRPALSETIRAVGSQVRQIVLIDNGSDEASQSVLKQASHDPQIRILRNLTNEGVASGLNQGLRWAHGRGFKFALTLDQDSPPARDMLAEQLAVLDTLEDPQKWVIVAPTVIDVEVGRKAPFLRKLIGPLYRRSICDKTVIEDVTTVITSGSLIRLSAFAEIGGFREDFFIDYVDTEFCLRARSLGYRIAVACRAKLYHRLGNRREVRVGPIRLYPTFHPPTRWYTISRNRVAMIRQWGLKFPHWLTYELVASAFTFLRMLATEDQKLAKLRAILRGTWDGVRGKMGGPPSAIG